jgi:hypothetical protein
VTVPMSDDLAPAEWTWTREAREAVYRLFADWAGEEPATTDYEAEAVLAALAPHVARQVSDALAADPPRLAPVPDDDRYVILPVQTPDGVVRWRIPRAPLTIPAPEQATGEEPDRVTRVAGSHQEPQTPALGSPDTPETLSGPLSAPDRDTA